jgi:hypothetical protein
MSDPLRTVWEALERAGCEPHGAAHDFRSRCPAHGGENREGLHVSIGADGRALIHCHPHRCPIARIVAALDLSEGDLFPAGHRHARRRDLREARRSEFDGPARAVVNILAAIEALGAEWYLNLRCDCPYCGAPAAIVQARSGGRALVSCPGDDVAERLGYGACTFDQFTQALAARLDDHKEAR